MPKRPSIAWTFLHLWAAISLLGTSALFTVFIPLAISRGRPPLVVAAAALFIATMFAGAVWLLNRLIRAHRPPHEDDQGPPLT